jgi:predicted metalloprotease with PDZ domain
MRKQILIIITTTFLSLLAHAGQTWTSGLAQPFGIPSEDSGTSSYLGVDIADVTPDRLGALKLKDEQGVEVTMVDQDAPAGKAGIKEHDVILSMNGTTIESKSQLQRMIHETPAGRVVSLGLSRDGQPLTIKVQLADRRSEFHQMGKSKDGDFRFEIPPIPPMPNMPDFDVPNIGVVVVHSSVRSGLMVENLTPQLGEFLGARNGHGVLVRSVEKGSRAEKAGLRAGDVIVRIGDQPVHDTSDFTHALHLRSAGSVNVGVIRDKKEQTITISLPERKDSGEMIEESDDAPELDSQTRVALRQVQDEVAELQPEMELAAEESREVAREVQQSPCVHQAEIRKQTEKLSREFGTTAREELLKNSERMRQQMRELRLEISGGLDI